MSLASMVLDAVEAWAAPALMLRELEAFAPHPVDAGEVIGVGRLDAMLVPLSSDIRFQRKRSWSYAARCLVGVEVKVSRRDLARGLKSGQLERYGRAVAGLYLACPRAMRVKPSELPDGVGLLTFTTTRHPVLCRRAALDQDWRASPEMLWKLMTMFHGQLRAERGRVDVAIRKATEAVGNEAAHRLAALCEARAEATLEPGGAR